MLNIISKYFTKSNVDVAGVNDGLERFVEAQKESYSVALAEIRAGRKSSHWMWYIFPQVRGLGFSHMSEYYGIRSLDEADDYLQHELLGARLREITIALLEHRGKDIIDILGDVDARKLRSSMTLFDIVSPNDIFNEVLMAFYSRVYRCRPTCHICWPFLRASSINYALDYIGIDPADFALENRMFARPVHEAIHGIGHVYRTMIGCAFLGYMTQRRREGMLAFCGAYIHDLARLTDDVEPEHGANSSTYYFHKFDALWDKYRLTEEERKMVCQAVEQHSVKEWMRPGDKGYDVMAILKDADALDRCRLGDLNERWLRYFESRKLVDIIARIYANSRGVNSDMRFDDFVKEYCK